jgi:hypothetical protein
MKEHIPLSLFSSADDVMAKDPPSSKHHGTKKGDITPKANWKKEN